MPRRIGFVRSILVLAVLVSLPNFLLARGGGGAGGGGGRGGFGGAYPGGRAVYHGAGFGGYGPGFRGPLVGYRGYGWGVPYYGYGLGMGLGLGPGYGLSSGYAYNYPVYGYGYPSYAYGYPGYAYGSGAYSSAVYAGDNTNSAPAPVVATPSVATSPVATSPVVTASATAPPSEATNSRSPELADQGGTAFKNGNYEEAAYCWRHAVVDDPKNPFLALRLGMALFAIGKHHEAAATTQAALRRLPKEQWGIMIVHYNELYGNRQDYTRQLRALEKRITTQPNDSALRFLAGYHYGYLGFLKQSVEQLEKGVRIDSRNETTQQLLDEMRDRLVRHDALPPAPVSVKKTSWIKSR